MSQYVTVTCKRYLSDFCYDECDHRNFGCAGENVLPRKKKILIPRKKTEESK